MKSGYLLQFNLYTMHLSAVENISVCVIKNEISFMLFNSNSEIIIEK